MKAESKYFTSVKATRLHYLVWPQTQSEACLLIVHGFGEHAARYSKLVEMLQMKHKIEAYALDLRGHGQSEGPRVFVDAFDDFVDDVILFRREIEQASACKRYFLFGHSMGGLIAVLTSLRRNPSWERLILSSPYFGLPMGDVPFGFVTTILGLIAPRMVWDNPIPPVYLTHDQEQLQIYANDTLIQRRISMQLAKEMLQATRNIWNKTWEVKLPLLLLAAGDDRIVSLKKTERFFSEISSKDKEMYIFDGFFHEIFQETEREKPINTFSQHLRTCLGR
jgi:alpha-beta hydrolase superfamily lysophospholipase